MKNILKFINLIPLLVMALLYNHNVKAQLPVNDATWILSHSDDFNSSTLNSQWITQYPWGSPVNNGLEFNSASNVLTTYSTGYLSIKGETITPYYYPPTATTYSFQSGIICSTWKAKYGYYEISAKMPTGSLGYWPAFWLYSQNTNTASPPVYYNEIDIVENQGSDSQSNTEMGLNYQVGSHTTGSWLYSVVLGPLTFPGVSMSAEHKYAVFWEPGVMTFYFDDNPIRVVVDPNETPANPMSVLINFAVDPDPASDRPTPSTVWPAYYHINYFNCWQLQAADAGCPLNTTESICSFNPLTYSYKIKKSISIGGSTCTNTINTSSNVSFWATDFVQLDESTTINADGSGSFTAITTPCPN